MQAYRDWRSTQEKHPAGYITDDSYQSALQVYYKKMQSYERKLKLYGPKREMTIDDFLILKYVYPKYGKKHFVLANDEEYDVPYYLRGTKIQDIKYPDKPFRHLDSYRKFLRMNPSISREVDSKYDIRAKTGSAWTLNKFIRMWVINHYTKMYEDLQIVED